MAHNAQVGALLAMIAALAGGCGGSDQSRAEGSETGAAASAGMAASGPRHVSNVMIGKRIGAGNRLTEPTFQFAPQDTVFLSVGTEGGRGPDRLTAAWRSQTGEVLQQSTETIKPEGQNTAFQLSKPKGLKPGTYKVIVFLGGDSVDTKVFVVKK